MSFSKRSTLARGVILMNIHVNCKVSLFYSCNLYAIEWFFLFCLKQEKLSASEKIAKLAKECQQLKQTIKTREADIARLQSQIDSKVRLLAGTLRAIEHEFLSRSFYQPIPNLLGLPATSCARNCPNDHQIILDIQSTTTATSFYYHHKNTFHDAWIQLDQIYVVVHIYTVDKVVASIVNWAEWHIQAMQIQQPASYHLRTVDPVTNLPLTACSVYQNTQCCYSTSLQYHVINGKTNAIEFSYWCFCSLSIPIRCRIVISYYAGNWQGKQQHFKL